MVVRQTNDDDKISKEKKYKTTTDKTSKIVQRVNYCSEEVRIEIGDQREEALTPVRSYRRDNWRWSASCLTELHRRGSHSRPHDSSTTPPVNVTVQLSTLANSAAYMHVSQAEARDQQLQSFTISQ